MSDTQEAAQRFQLEVPLDATSVEDFRPEQPVKVLIQLNNETTDEQIVQLDEGGKGAATFRLAQRPRILRVIVGPGDATADELLGLQTISVDVPVRLWKERQELVLPPIQISTYYWHWWLRWCRTFVIRGRVLCPDGSPVPGATVCAYDVDAWWWWCSKQQVGCATTDVNGVFTIKFRWCCGWWPWWWWKHRFWHLEPALAEAIVPALQKHLQIPRLPTPSPRPDLAIFEGLLGDRSAPPSLAPQMSAQAMASRKAASSRQDVARPAETEIDPEVLDKLGARLRERLPSLQAIERLKLWPWWPWHPWWDCTPDIIFKATQPCSEQTSNVNVIVNETCWDTRWDIPTVLDVTLVANEQACCIPPGHGCEEGNCLALTEACDDIVKTIGGNVDALADPRGYKNPGDVATTGDRPYAGIVPISGSAECMTDVDYYEFEWSKDGTGVWHTMPAAAAGSFTRTYIDFGPPLDFVSVPFASTPIGGHNVFETLSHYEAIHGSQTWLGSSRDLLMNWLTENNFADGVYQLRVKGWDLVAADTLDNQRTLKMCESDEDNFIVLAIDNRVVGPGSGHPASTPDHPVGPGTVHTLTLEPDTDILDARLIHRDGTETVVGACGVVKAKTGDLLQVDFFAHDPDGHLAYYTLNATYGENQISHLLGLGGTLIPSPLAAPVPAATQVGPTYADARSAAAPPDGGAVAPIWHGGAIRLRVPATGPAGTAAFPETCCYQLELRAHKRTIVSCDDSLWGHINYSEFSFMVEV